MFRKNFGLVRIQVHICFTSYITNRSLIFYQWQLY